MLNYELNICKQLLNRFLKYYFNKEKTKSSDCIVAVSKKKLPSNSRKGASLI